MPKRASLDTDQFRVELPQPQRDPLDTLIPITPPPVQKHISPSQSEIKKAEGEKARNRASKPDSKQAIALSGYQDITIEIIRKAVKFVGKDPFFGRFTPEEKGMLADLAYKYKKKGTRTSENEIARIAVNFIMADYEQNGKNCILEQVLRALNE